MPPMSTKDFSVEIKSVSDEGTFEGILSVYNVVDLGGDLIEPGAFTKTLQESKGRIPCLAYHDTRQPVGTLDVTDTGGALEVKGQLVLEVQTAREMLALMKAGVVRSLSIGYRTIKSAMEDGVRHLKEIALMEGSIVLFPMLPLAQITSVKDAESKDDFLVELDRAQTFSMRYMMIRALEESLDSIVWDGEMDSTEKITASDESIAQFQKAYVTFLPKLFELWGEKSVPTPEQKAGRRLSSASQALIRAAISNLQALLEPEAAKAAVDCDANSTKPAGAAEAKGDETSTNSPLKSVLTTFKF